MALRSHSEYLHRLRTPLALAALGGAAACGDAPVRSVADAVAAARGQRIEIVLADGRRLGLDSARVVGDSVIGWGGDPAVRHRDAVALAAIRDIGWGVYSAEIRTRR
jgi:hypothetical protein